MTGATTSVSPSPNTITAGSTVETYESPGSIRVISSIPAAITSGPTVSGMRAPMRCARAPERADSASISAVTGSDAAPAASGD